ncbi:hypothetical protein M0813_11574 [Anaeramoeba flamelloides]|uniref:Uncharacterized protein n=1 Tax=Anaeramoeba flamelloides TaxID=1746091 RepID=A0ABQ8ZF47_9EUKA|nr:hypothetical protein M0813_11574 [Anaeramoeba flamelloides]
MLKKKNRGSKRKKKKKGKKLENIGRKKREVPLNRISSPVIEKTKSRFSSMDWLHQINSTTTKGTIWTLEFSHSSQISCNSRGKTQL